MISRIIKTEVCVIHRRRRLRWITLTEVLIILNCILISATYACFREASQCLGMSFPIGWGVSKERSNSLHVIKTKEIVKSSQ